MPTTDPRAQFDLVIDRMITALTAYSTAQAVINSAVAFRAVPGSFRTVQPSAVPTIGVHLAGMRSAIQTGQGRDWDLLATYNLDLIANGKTTGAARGDSVAHARLMYLVTQALNALFDAERRATIEAGVVQLSWPTWMIAEPESYQEERPLIGGRLSIDCRSSFVPAPAVGAPIDSIHVDTTLWSALYEYTEGYY